MQVFRLFDARIQFLRAVFFSSRELRKMYVQLSDEDQRKFYWAASRHRWKILQYKRLDRFESSLCKVSSLTRRFNKIQRQNFLEKLFGEKLQESFRSLT